MIIPNKWKIKNVPNHQSVIITCPIGITNLGHGHTLFQDKPTTMGVDEIPISTPWNLHVCCLSLTIAAIFPPHVCCLKSKMSLAKSQIFMLQYICLPKILNLVGDFTIFLALLQHLRNTSPCRESKAAKQPTEGWYGRPSTWQGKETTSEDSPANNCQLTWDKHGDFWWVFGALMWKHCHLNNIPMTSRKMWKTKPEIENRLAPHCIFSLFGLNATRMFLLWALWKTKHPCWVDLELLHAIFLDRPSQSVSMIGPFFQLNLSVSRFFLQHSARKCLLRPINAWGYHSPEIDLKN